MNISPGPRFAAFIFMTLLAISASSAPLSTTWTSVDLDNDIASGSLGNITVTQAGTGMPLVSGTSTPATVVQVSALPDRYQAPAEKPSPIRSESMRHPIQFPRAARVKGVGGYVIVQFTLPDKGFPTDVVIVLSEPSGEFEKSCVAYAKRLHFDVPAVWVARNPDRRLEIACVYEVIGSPNPPAMQDFPGMFTAKVSTVPKS